LSFTAKAIDKYLLIFFAFFVQMCRMKDVSINFRSVQQGKCLFIFTAGCVCVGSGKKMAFLCLSFSPLLILSFLALCLFVWLSFCMLVIDVSSSLCCIFVAVSLFAYVILSSLSYSHSRLSYFFLFLFFSVHYFFILSLFFLYFSLHWRERQTHVQQQQQQQQQQKFWRSWREKRWLLHIWN